MKAWWEKLSSRDRAALVLLAIFVGAVAAWGAVWLPLDRARTRLSAQVAQAEGDLAFMQGAAGELKRLRATGALNPMDRAGKSLLALADASAREAGLGAALKRVEPVGAGRVNVWFEGVPFDALVAWLEQLDQRFGVRSDELSAERAAQLGTVDARIGLTEAVAP
jgi:general secretion pathway protein M